MSTQTLGIILLSGTHDRAHAALSLAVAAGAIGRHVTLFATGGGCRALLDDWSGLRDVGRDAVIRRRGVSGFGTLRDAGRELGIRFLVCDAGLKGEALEGEPLMQGAEVAGLATFLESVGAGQLVSF